MKTIRCTGCSAEFSDEELQGRTSCPACGTDSVPCDIADDVAIDINWHELRILCMWATNYAVSMKKPNSSTSLRNIISRLEAQYPTRTKLTLAGELAQLRDKGYTLEIVTEDEVEEHTFVAPKPLLM